MKYLKEETRFSGKYSQTVLHTISMSLQTFKKKFIFFLILGFIGRALLLLNTNLIGKWADSHFKNPELFLFLLLSITSVGFIFYGTFRIMIARLGSQAASNLYDETTLRVSRFPVSFFDTTPVGRIITRFSSDYNAIFRMAGGALGEFLSITFDLFLFFFLIFLASPFYIPIILLSIFLNLMVYKFNKKKIREARREHSLIKGPAIAHFAETIQGSKTIRVYGKERSFTDRFLKKFDEYICQKNKSNLISNLFSLQMSLINLMLLLCTGLFGIFLAQKGYVSIGSIGVAFTFISMTQTTVQIFFEWISAVEDAATGTERMSEYLHREIEPGSLLPIYSQFETGHTKTTIEDENLIQNKNLFSGKNLGVHVSSLCVRYHESLPRALDDVSFTLKPSEKIGIIGSTGSGKTTLIQSLFHLYPFEKGSISIGGYSAWLDTSQPRKSNEIPLDLFRSAISLITQDPILFTGTLRDNLAFEKSMSDSEIYSVIKSLDMKAPFLNQPEGLNLKIQEKGANLSLGEKQVICMMRCFIQNAPIILMDEATSSIDPASEEIIVAASKKILKNKTQIIIAHRLSTIEDCDRLLWLNGGKIMMMGTPNVVLPEFLKFKKEGML